MQYFMDKTVHLFTARITTKMTITHSSLFGVYVHFCPALSTCFHNTPGNKRHYSKYIPKTIGRQKPFHFRSRGPECVHHTMFSHQQPLSYSLK